MKISSLLPALAITTFALAAVADGKCRVIDKPKISFTAVGPGGLKIDGTGEDLKVDDDGKRLLLKASVKNLKTGIGLRDNHTRKYIEAEKYPEATLKVDRSSLKFPEDKKKSEGSATGKFKLHGVEKDLTFNYTASRHGSDLIVTGRTKIDIKDYNIEKPCYLGVCVDTGVTIAVNFKLREE
jgi:polyisoprenoid-binding protein YceI